LNTASNVNQNSALLTGATGFIGNHLAKKLLREGWQVHLVIRESSDVGKLESLPGLSKLHQHNGTTDGMIKIMQAVRPNVVFHIASQLTATHVPKEVESVILSNILFGTQLLEAMIHANVRYFVNTGTFWQHYEGKEYNPVDLYAATKEAFQAILRYYTECTPIRAITLKLFDVYGPGDTRNKLFHLFEKTHQTGETLAMTPGEQYLDLVYIDDVVEAFYHAAELLRSSEGRVLEDSYAVSSSQRIRLKEVVTTYERLSGRRLNIHWGGRAYRAREIMKPCKGKALPGWKARIDLETGIRLMLSESNEGTLKKETLALGDKNRG